MKDHEYRMKNLEKLNNEVATLKNRLNQLYIDKVDGVIDSEFYFEKKNEWDIELDKLLVSQNEMSHENEEIMQTAESLHELSKRLHSGILGNHPKINACFQENVL